MGLGRCALWLAAGSGLLVLTPCANAQGQPERALDQPSMPLDQALARAAEALGIQLLFDPTPLRHQQAPAIKVRLTPAQALAQLLAGSHFQAVSGNGRIFVLRPAPTTAPAPHPSAPAQPNPAWPPIIVTAARYSQDAQKSALALSILPGRGLAMAAATGAERVLNGIPGINSSRQPDGISINIRGLGADMPSGTTQGSVALEFDGIYSIMALGTSIGWYDIDRVEISKGPQSTRYGPNAEGGIVNVITAQPRLNDFSGSATVTLGSAGLRRVEAGQTIPLGPRAALRLSGMAAVRNSWFTPALADLATQSMRANLLFEPSAPLQFRVGAEISHLGGTGGGAEADVPFVVDKVAPYAADSINASGNPWALGDRTEGRNHADLWQSAITGHASLRLGQGAVLDAALAHLSIAGHQAICPHAGAPWLISGASSCYTVHEFAPFGQTSAELRLHSPDARPWHWNIGQYLWTYGKTSWAQADQTVPGPAGASHVGARTLALFGEVTAPVRDGWRVVGGLRQSWDHRVLRPASMSTTYAADFHHTDFRLGYEYDVARDVLHYTTLASGYRPGGLTYDGNLSDARRFDAESTLALESGIKASLGRVLQFNLAAYAYRQSHYQDIDNYNGFSVTLANGQSYVCAAGGAQPAQCSVPVFNIARASSYGLEGSIRVRPGGNDHFDLEAALMHARFGKNLPTCATVAAPQTPGCWIGYNDQQTGALHFFRLDGSVQPHAPAFTLRLRYEHSFHLRSGGVIRAQGDGFHSSGYWVGPVQDAALFGWQSAYWTGGLSVSYRAASARFELSAYVRNLANYAVKMSALPATTLGDPRNIGLSARLDW